MKKHGNNRNGASAAIAATAVLFVVLIGLTAALIMTFLASSAEVDTFDLERVTADTEHTERDITGYFLPEFAGITVDGVRRGVSSPSGIVEEIFRLAVPVISEVMTAARQERQLTEEDWIALAEEEDSVYFRLHQNTPQSVLALFSSLYHNRDSGTAAEGYVYEILVLPFRAAAQGKSGIIRVAVRDIDGNAYLYVKASPESVLTEEQLEQTASSYRLNLADFEFAGDRYSVSSPTEPVMLSSGSYRNLIITGNTASMISDDQQKTEKLLRLFALNPDKLLNTHVDADGTRSYIDTKGILYIRKDEIEYLSTSEGGIRVSKLTDVRWDTPAHTLESYLGAADAIWNSIRSLGSIASGEEADLLLSSVSSVNGAVTLKYFYSVDNLRIDTGCPAFEAVFEKGVLRSVKVHTVAVMILGTRSEILSEHWFLRSLDGKIPDNVTPVYRARYASIDSADFATDTVAAEWAGISAVRKEETDGT